MDHQTPGPRTLLLALLTVAVCLNYIDRGTLAIAAPLIQGELHLTATELGVLLSSCFWSYVLMHVPAGWLAERYGAHRVLASGVALWSLATALTSVAGTFATLLALRLLLGVGESVYFPCSSKLLASEVDLRHRAMANGLIGFGLALGPAVGTYLGGELIAVVGWRAVFALFGCASLVWLVPWRRVAVPRTSVAPATVLAAQQPLPLTDILRQRALWGTSLGHLSANYTFNFMLSWLPFYLVKARGFSLAGMAGIAGFAYLLNALGSVASGWVTDRWIRQGVSANRVYKLIMAVNHVGAAVVTIGAVMAGPVTAIACLCFYQLLAGISGPGVYAIGQTLAGPRAAGRWIGIQNMVANLGGIAAPVITGVLVDSTGTFVAAFVLAAAINVVGLLGWLVMIPRVAPLEWAAVGHARTGLV
jgi:MFS family permease